MIQRRPILWATAPVVPEPAKESSTQSPGFVVSSITRFNKPSGFFPFGKSTPPSLCKLLEKIFLMQEKRSQKSKISGVLNGGVLEVTGNTGRPMIKGTHPALHTRAQGFLVVGQALLVDIAFEVVVQVLVGVHLRGMRRQIEH